MWQCGDHAWSQSCDIFLKGKCFDFLVLAIRIRQHGCLQIDCSTCQPISLRKSRRGVNKGHQRWLTLWFACVPPRSTPSTSSSVRAGETRGWSLTDPCRSYPSTTSWPAKSGLPTPFSTTGRSRWPTTWRLPTSCCVLSTTARFSTQWGEFLPDF